MEYATSLLALSLSKKKYLLKKELAQHVLCNSCLISTENGKSMIIKYSRGEWAHNFNTHTVHIYFIANFTSITFLIHLPHFCVCLFPFFGFNNHNNLFGFSYFLFFLFRMPFGRSVCFCCCCKIFISDFKYFVKCKGGIFYGRLSVWFFFLFRLSGPVLLHILLNIK